MTVKRRFISLALLFSVLSSCYSSKIPLTPEEEKYVDVLARKYQAAVKMQHDFSAIRENRKDGAFFTELKNSADSLCEKDSASLKRLSSQIAQGLLGVMSQQQHYSFVQVVFVTEKKSEAEIYETLCIKEMLVNIKDLNDVRIRRWEAK